MKFLHRLLATLASVLFASAVYGAAATITSGMQIDGTILTLGAGNVITCSTCLTTGSGQTLTAPVYIGATGFTDTGVGLQNTGNTNGYYQEIVQNTSSGAAASADFIAANNSATTTTFYGDFGINSSGFTGSGSFNIPSATYLYAASGDLAIGTITSNAIHFVINNSATDAMAISTSGNTTMNGTLQTAGAISDVSTTTNAVITANGHEASGGGAYFKVADDVLGNVGYFGQNSVIFGGTSYKEFSIINPQSAGTICLASNNGGSSTANTGCDILIDASNNVTVSHALNPPSGRKGTFVCTGGGTITISNANMASTSNVIISMSAQGGTITTPPAMKTVTGATGFTVLCGATDTSTYNYAILN